MEKTLKRVYRSRYQNYHYHQEPRLDITKVPSSLHATADIISCSEVLEHVAPPVNLAFNGLRNLLKSDGMLIVSVPHTDALGEHVEHFPVMRSFEIQQGSEVYLSGELMDGRKVIFKNLTFHGGVGSTLEFRIFSQNSLLKELECAGFTSVTIHGNSKILGVAWENWSRVWSAQSSA